MNDHRAAAGGNHQRTVRRVLHGELPIPSAWSVTPRASSVTQDPHHEREATRQARRWTYRVAAVRTHPRQHPGGTGMNEPTLTQLKALVERAVRSVQASTSRKWKMREELLAHVTAVFDEEAARS